MKNIFVTTEEDPIRLYTRILNKKTQNMKLDLCTMYKMVIIFKSRVCNDSLLKMERNSYTLDSESLKNNPYQELMVRKLE